jgi:Icc protein
MPTTHRPISLVQITDCHLRAAADAPLGWDVPGAEAVYPEPALETVLAEILAERPLPDLLLATGDLAQDPCEATYRRLARRLAALPVPVHCLPGNHDDAQLLSRVMQEEGHPLVRALSLGEWLIVLLDTTEPGRSAGHLGTEELALLEEVLSRHPAPHALIALHHHPVPVGSPWLDELGLQDSDALFDVLCEHAQVRGLICGHVHQPFEAERSGIRILSAPATCVQFEPATQHLALALAAPAYRRLWLHPDGRIETRLCTAVEEIRRSA